MKRITMHGPEANTEDAALRSLLCVAADASAERAMQPFVADRIMRRIARATRSDELLQAALWRFFRPVAIASFILMLAFVGYNSTVSRSYEVPPTATEVVLGLQPVTLTTAYGVDMYPLLAAAP